MLRPVSRSIRAVESPQLPSSEPPVAVPETEAEVTVPDLVYVTMLSPPLPPEPPEPPVGDGVGVALVCIAGVFEVVGGGVSVVDGSGAGSEVDGSGAGSEVDGSGAGAGIVSSQSSPPLPPSPVGSGEGAGAGVVVG